MAKFFGAIGYGTLVETPAGVWVNTIVEKSYYGDVVRNAIQFQEGEPINDDLSVSNSISIVADEYANGHISAMRYIRWAGALWKISNIEVKSPRLLLRLGGVYNGPTPG